jgi:ankyrin repeat protein
MAERAPTLDEVLRRVSQLADWFDAPATSASDRAVTGDYPLHKVAIWGDVEAAKVLLDAGADINSRGEDDDTPLHRAIMGNHVAMAAYLLSRGADPDQRDRYGFSPRETADTPPMIELLRTAAKLSGP